MRAIVEYAAEKAAFASNSPIDRKKPTWCWNFAPTGSTGKFPGTGHVYIGGGTDVPFYTGMDVSTPATWTEYYGSGLVYRRVAEDRIRVLTEYTGDQPSRSRDHHPKQFAKAFIKAWRKANGQ